MARSASTTAAAAEETAHWTRKGLRQEHLPELEDEDGEEGWCEWVAQDGVGAHLKCGARHAIGEPGLLGRLTSGRWSPLGDGKEGSGGGRGRRRRPGDGADGFWDLFGLFG